MSFYVIPKDKNNGVAKEIQVLNSERIIGYSTYSSMARGDKDAQTDHSFLMTNDDSDYYNVTVNFIVKKGGATMGDFASSYPTPTPSPVQ
jgi:hypothetical protein